MNTPHERLESLLKIHSGRCAIREMTDLAVAAYEMEKRKQVKIEPQIECSGGYKMIVITKL